MNEKIDKQSLVEQLDREKRNVSFDAYDISVRQLVDMAGTALIDVAPDYQRLFIWDLHRESELVESIFLGIPIPSLFMATNKDGSWEVVDGVQRLSTLLHFCGENDAISKVGKEKPLALQGLNKLTAFNGYTFKKLPESLQLAFTLRPLRVTTLNDKSDLLVRYDLFERLNTGGIILHDQEIRNVVFRGPATEQIKALAQNSCLRSVLYMPDNEEKESNYQQAVLRFFAYLNRYLDFKHLVKEFLSGYLRDHYKKELDQDEIELFNKTMTFLGTELPNGVSKGSKYTLINLFEAAAVGTALVLKSGARPKTGVLEGLLIDPELEKFTKGGTNTKKMVVGRIDYVKNAL